MNFCEDITCIYNDGTACLIPDRETVMGYGTVDGITGVFNYCNSYKGVEDAGTD